MTQLEQYIKSYFGVAPTDMELVTSFFKPEQLKVDDFFMRQGQHKDSLGFIKEGFIRVYKDDGKKEITQWISTEGYFITDLNSLVFNQPVRWNMQAITDCSLYVISGKHYRELSQLLPVWDELQKRFIAKCFMQLEDRVFSHLSLSAEERYTLFFNQNKDLFNRVPLHYLASMLGMTPETFSRIRAKLNS
jgi:CRP-like cAMP-binding protein